MNKANGESKSAKFSRLASASKALNAIRQIGNLSSRSSYDYTPQQVAKITTALSAAIEETASRFKGPAASKHDEFTV